MGLFDSTINKQADLSSLEGVGKNQVAMDKNFLFGNGQTIQNPQRNIVGLDSATESLMNQREHQANRTPEEIAAQMQTGVQQDSGAAFKDMGLMNQGMGGPGNPMMGAIQNRQSRNYLRDVNGIKRQAEYQAPLEKQKEMQAVMQDKMARANAAAGIADRDRQQQLADWQHDQNQIAARRQIVGTLFGAVGSAVGGYFGGAAGAKAGGAAGKGTVGGTTQTTGNY